MRNGGRRETPPALVQKEIIIIIIIIPEILFNTEYIAFSVFPLLFCIYSVVDYYSMDCLQLYTSSIY
jgi:hypothetical protein